MWVIWGIPYLMIRVAVRELAPVALVFFRTGIAALVLLPFALARDQLRPLLPRWRPVVVYTVVEVAIPWVLLGSAETKISLVLAGSILATGLSVEAVAES
jgi:drug/metabolite transporter (DMT)-like permease